MAAIIEALKGINAYPVPVRTFNRIAMKRGIELTDEATQDTLNGKAFNLAYADVLMWLSYAPNITQGGQSYSFTDEQRTQLRREAQVIYNEYGEDETSCKPIYGYKGSRL
jgi:hypothetical protein